MLIKRRRRPKTNPQRTIKKLKRRIGFDVIVVISVAMLVIHHVNNDVAADNNSVIVLAGSIPLPFYLYYRVRELKYIDTTIDKRLIKTMNANIQLDIIKENIEDKQ